MFFTSIVLLACWALFITMLFPLVARCDNTTSALFKMGIAMALRNVMPVLAGAAGGAGAGELLQRLFVQPHF